MSQETPVVIAPEGEVDLHSSTLLKERLEIPIEGRKPKIIVDLGSVSYIDSSGLAVLIEAMQRIEGYGGVFAICGLRDNVRHIFSIARLDQVFRIYPDRAAAQA